jgi:hypothetical protein
MLKRLGFVVIAAVALTATPGFAKNSAGLISARSWCPMTGASGIGKGPTLAEARPAAVKQCIANGGMPACCTKFVRQI